MKSEREELYGLIDQLCDVIRNTYNAHEIQFKELSTGIQYDVKLGKPNMSHSFEVVNYRYVDPPIRSELDEVIRNSEEYIKCERFLRNKKLFGHLRLFEDRTVNNIDLLTYRASTINNFLDYIYENFEFLGEYYFDCIQLEEDYYDLFDGIRVEKVNRLKFVYHFSGSGPNMDNIREVETRIVFSATGKIPDVLNGVIRNLHDAIILVKSEPINLVYSQITSNSLFLNPRTDYHHNWLIGLGLHKVLINKSDVCEIIEIYERYKDFYHSDEEYIKVAMARYKDALYSQMKYEGKIAFSIASLEALFNVGNDDLKYKLCIRASQLLRMFEYLPENNIWEDVYQRLSRAYSIRSGYVHGNKLSKKKVTDVGHLFKEVLDINRACIVCFITLLPSYTSKENLLNAIDLTLINSGAYAQMQRAIFD